MEKIEISKEVFDDIKPLLKDYIKDNCDYCNEKITRNNFGMLSKNVTCCNHLMCLFDLIKAAESDEKTSSSELQEDEDEK